MNAPFFAPFDRHSFFDRKAFFLVICLILGTEGWTSEANPSPKVELHAEECSVLLECLRGVLLVPCQAVVDSSGVEVEGFDSTDLRIPGGARKLNNRLEDRYIGKPLTRKGLTELKRDLIIYYRDQGYPVITVEIPEQSLGKGTIQLIVTEGTLGNVVVEGNKYFSKQSYQKIMQHKQKEPIHFPTVLNDVAWINRNPFRHADLFLTPGDMEGETNVELMVKDKFPLMVYSGRDNTGVNPTGQPRWFTGFHWGNAFNLGHILSYQFTVGPEYHKFWAHTFYYNAPLPWRHVLLLYGGYAFIHPNITGFRSSGNSSQASLRYQIPIKSYYDGFIQEFTWGFDYKGTNTSLFFVEMPPLSEPVVTKQVNVTQLYAGYSLGKSWPTNQISFEIEAYWSPGEWIANQENQNFSELHPGAVNHYVYGAVTLTDVLTLPKNFSIQCQVRGQISNENLVPSEQFGLGGYDTVRGYPEREVNYDDAFCANIEFYLPPFRIFRFLKKHPDEFKFLGFFDYGTGRNVHYSGATQWQQLIGIGPGFRYKIQDFFSVRFDWGWRLHEIQYLGKGSKIHFGLIAQF